MSYNFHSEATANAARTRQKPPTKRELAQAKNYRGVALIYRGDRIHLWEPSGPYGARWLAPACNLSGAWGVIDQMLGGAA